MRRVTAGMLILSATVLAGCGWQSSRRAMDVAWAPAPSPRAMAPATAPLLKEAAPPPDALPGAAEPQTAPVWPERKVIRNAELAVELDAPVEGKRRAEAMAETMGGFVVTSDVTQGDGESAARAVVTIVLRVPAAKFAEAVAEIRKLGRVRREKITGQDVTEEYVDLEARLRAKRALETQLLDILKQARKVSDALEVQKALADVRTEIERAEGRQRYLQNQVSLSTLHVTLEPPAPLVSASAPGMWRELKQAVGDGCEAAIAVVLLLVRGVIAFVPVLLFIGVPGFYLLRLVRRRWRMRNAAPAQ